MRDPRIWLLVLLSMCSLSAITARSARAQTVYQDEFLDDPTDLGTESLLEDCGEGGCGCSTSVSSTLNGEEVGLPPGQAEYQYVNPATPGTEYLWTISGETTCCYPLVGCKGVNWGWTYPVVITNTWYGPPVSQNPPGDTCYYYNQSTGETNLYCTQGTPFCDTQFYEAVHIVNGVNTCPTAVWIAYIVMDQGQDCEVQNVTNYMPGSTIPTTRTCN